MIRLWLRLTCLLLLAAIVASVAVVRYRHEHPSPPPGPQIGYGVRGGFTFTQARP